ncbi:two-component sensor histidine kinase [Vagococcus penaei]|uniref:histidine kinase n=1 Tax=Vagococcus penaei TaxID=633807 RepID=A0A1Q2D878_9ENTE|nr:sensor histidine kinase [Vagococcus penaei]AQP54521.1 two-component sensor histidine kinase [Vagococcus penaei]RSU06771.1 two-component sensor histidine kinase [Vagococcus penaei]
MIKPSNKLLKTGIVSVVILTILGIVITANSYFSTQKHAIKMGENQLSKINDSAIKILTLEIKSYSLALEDYASDLVNDGQLTDLTQTEKIKQKFHYPSSVATGLYLLSPEGTLLSGWKFKDYQLMPTKQNDLHLLTKDPKFKLALQGDINQNGEAYFNNNQSFLNLYRPIVNEQNQVISILVLPINLENLYQLEFGSQGYQKGYTMIKNRNMKVVMHPSLDQVGLDIVEDRKEKFPERDFKDLENLEKVQSSNKKGTLSYYSYWWTEEEPEKVLKISAYEWMTLGDTEWIVASSSDFYEKNGYALQKNLIILGLLAILLAIIILLGLSFHSYNKRNKIYLENLKLIERQQALHEKHETEKNLLQKSKLETVGLLTTTIVHDMNNFLTPMIGNLQLLIDDYQENPDLVTELDEVYQAAEKGQQLAANVLRFTTVNSSKKTINDIQAVVCEAVTTMRMLLSANIEFKSGSTPQQLSAYFEKSDLEVVLYNLITNAFQAQIINPYICVTIEIASEEQLAIFQNHSHAYQEKDFALIRVIDKGPGIPKEIEQKMFTPFFTTKSDENGTGLGLFIISSMTKKNDWILDVESSEKGTAFIIGIPIQ